MRRMAGYIGRKGMVPGIADGIKRLQDGSNIARYTNTPSNIIEVAAHNLGAEVSAE